MIFAECFTFLAAKAWTPARSTNEAATQGVFHDAIEQFKSTQVRVNLRLRTDRRLGWFLLGWTNWVKHALVYSL